MANKNAKGAGMHKMPGGHMMSDAQMARMMGKKGKGKGKKASKRKAYPKGK